MQAGEAGLLFPIDSEAGTAGCIPSTAGSTATLLITSTSEVLGNYSNVSVTSRLVATGDNRTYTYTTAATDFPFAGTYNLQLVLSFPGNVIRKSPQVRLAVLPSN